MLIFTCETLFSIIQALKAELGNTAKLSFAVPNPDLGRGLYAGETLTSGLIHRPWRVWFDLAEKLECRLLRPEVFSSSHVIIHLETLLQQELRIKPRDREKYGAGSDFSRIHKLEESAFLLDYLEALERIALKAGARVLSLGVNSAEEFRVFDYLGTSTQLSFVGIDHSRTALELAKQQFPKANYRFIEADIHDLGSLELGQFDLVMSLGTLQSPAIDDRSLLRQLVQDYLRPQGSLLIAFPNAKYLDAELLYGARMKNFSQADMSLLIKDTAYYRKYLHQHHFKVFITGKYYLLITAIPATSAH